MASAAGAAPGVDGDVRRRPQREGRQGISLRWLLCRGAAAIRRRSRAALGPIVEVIGCVIIGCGALQLKELLMVPPAVANGGIAALAMRQFYCPICKPTGAAEVGYGAH